MSYVLISQLIRTSTYNWNVLETTFENGEVTAFGWIPVMALCVTISGFVIFFNNCRPFTRFRKVLFIAILVVVLLVLFLIPEFFIISGRKLLAAVAGPDTRNIMQLFPYITNHISKNVTLAFFRTMNLEQGLFVIIYAALAYPIYLLNEKLAGRVVEFFLFSTREFKDE